MTAAQYNPVLESHINDLPSLQEQIIRQIHTKKEELYKDILRQILKREPIIEDGKDAEIVIHDSFPDQELIAYKGQPIGRIIFSMDNDIVKNTFTWTFEPETTFKK